MIFILGLMRTRNLHHLVSIILCLTGPSHNRPGTWAIVVGFGSLMKS
jgi:hypothetical protein